MASASDVTSFLLRLWQLEILPHCQWYISSGVFDPDRVLQNWVSKANYAEARGYAGMRIARNPFWLESVQEWKQFGFYEQAVTDTICHERVLALCTYPIEICRINHGMQILSSHGTALISQNDQWQRLPLSQH